jgi:uncharacterized protein YraI
MRGRIWAIVAIVVALAAVTACAARDERGPANTPVPTKTLRPTFTATAPKPTLAPTATPEVAAAISIIEATAEPPTATAQPPTATTAPPATPETAALTVTSAALNVRSGPGTNYPVLGRLTSGQTFPVTGKNAAGSWWEFDYNGRKGWVVGTNVSVRGAGDVQVAQSIPAAPTAPPRPTARPQAAQPQPTQPPAQPQPASTKYGQTKAAFRMVDTNDWVTVYCMLWNRAVNDLLPSTIQITRDGQVVEQGKAFTKFGTWYLNYPYNDGCKVEIRPAANGNYTAVLIEGGNPVSDPINFTVTGQGDRITFLEWKEK